MPVPAALTLAQHCRRAVRLPAHDRRASSTLQRQAAGGTYPRTQRGPSTFGKKVNGRRISGASRKSLFRNSFWSPRACSDYPPDETWGDRVACEFIPADRQGSPRRRGNMRPNAGTGFLRIPPFVNGCIGNAGNYIYEDKAKKFKPGTVGTSLDHRSTCVSGGLGQPAVRSAPQQRNALPRRGIL